MPIDTSTISSLGKSFLLFAYAQAAGLLANTPPSTNTLFSCLTSKYLGAKYVGAAVVALSASFNLMKFLFSLQLLRKNGRVENWRAYFRVWWLIHYFHTGPQSKFPYSRFQLPPHQTQHAIFPHYAFLVVSLPKFITYCAGKAF